MLAVIIVGGAAAAGLIWKRQGAPPRPIRRFIGEARQELSVLAQSMRAAAVRLDNSYQGFMVKRLDPLLGRPAFVLLPTTVTQGNELVCTEKERQLNWYLGASTVSFGTAVIALVYPPILIVTLSTALYSALPLFKRAYFSLVKDRKLVIAMVGSLYFIGVYAGGFFMAGSFCLAGYFLSSKLLSITQDRSLKNLTEVFGRQPRTVWLLTNGVEVEVPFETVQAGDTIVVHAGALIPVDGIVVLGNATIDQHQLTGEGQPSETGMGDRVLASTLVVAGRIRVRVEKTGKETAAAHIGEILNNTASYQADTVSKGERIGDLSVTPTLAFALIALPVAGYHYMVTVLGSSIGNNVRVTAPLAMLNFLNIAADRGILIKDGRSLELLRGVDTVVFDKTGTLTLQQPVVAAIHIVADLDEDALLMYAAAAEHRQTHPVARAILAEAARRGMILPEIENAHYEVGYGLKARLGEKLIRIGSRRFMVLESIAVPDHIEYLCLASQQNGNSVVMVAVDDHLAGLIELQSALRPEAREIVEELQRRKLDLYIISGDHLAPTQRLAKDLNIPRYFADTAPESKAALVESLQREGRVVCFVGDGINDSIALKKAHVSVSLGGASTAATDSAQIVLMAESLRQLPFVFDLAREFDGNMKAGTWVAVSQGVVIIAGALFSLVGIIGGIGIWAVSMAAGIGIAMHPLYKYRPAQLPAKQSDTGWVEA